MKNYTIFAGVNGAGKTSIYPIDKTDMFKIVMVIENENIIWKDRNLPKWLRLAYI